jgi:serine acetyltransferase
VGAHAVVMESIPPNSTIELQHAPLVIKTLKHLAGASAGGSAKNGNAAPAASRGMVNS